MGSMRTTSKKSRSDPARRSAAAQQARSRRDRRAGLAALILALAAVALFLFFFLAPKGAYARWTSAVSVGDQDVSTPVYNCYYGKAAVELQSMFSMGGGNPPTGDAWRAAVLQQADPAVQSDYAVCAAAKKAGWTLPPEQQEALRQEMELVADLARSNGFSDTDSYLAATLGKGCDLESYRTYTETVLLAQSYRDAFYAGLTFSPEEIRAAYETSPETFDVVDFRSFYLKGADAAQAQALAGSITDEASFVQMARENSSADEAAAGSDPDATLEHMLVSHLNEENRAWLTHSDRTYGDVGVIPYRSAGCFLLFYIGRNQDPAARDRAVEEHLRQERFAQWTGALAEEYPLRHHRLGLAGVAR